jgi:hypothetical protein
MRTAALARVCGCASRSCLALVASHEGPKLICVIT